jgi:hypothetical protein
MNIGERYHCGYITYEAEIDPAKVILVAVISRGVPLPRPQRMTTSRTPSSNASVGVKSVLPSRAVYRRSRVHVHTPTGHKRAAMVMAARTAATGRLKKGRMLPSDLMSEVTKACSTIVPMTIPSTIAATG